MNDRELNKKLLDIMEYGMGPEIMPGAEERDEERENVTYSKTKSKGDASVTISANAKSMQELHDVLKLAGITLPKNDDQPEEEPEEKPEEEPKADDHDHEDGEECDACAGEIDDPSYTTDKQAIIDRLRDTLKAKLIR